MLRVSLAVGIAVSVLFVGVTAISESAQQHTPDSAAGSDGAALADGVFGGALEAAGPAVVVGGVAAIVLVSLGVLLSAGRTGGR